MKRMRFTEEQIIGVLKEAQAGAKSADLDRRHKVLEATIYAGSLSMMGWRYPRRAVGTGRLPWCRRCRTSTGAWPLRQTQ